MGSTIDQELFGASTSSADTSAVCAPCHSHARATATWEFPPNVLQHRTFCFCLNGAETGILCKKNVSRSIFKQEMARRETGMGAERGGTKYAPGQCYCCTSYRTELSMALSVNSLTTEKTVLKTPLVRAPAPLRHSGFGTL